MLDPHSGLVLLDLVLEIWNNLWLKIKLDKKKKVSVYMLASWFIPHLTDSCSALTLHTQVLL